MTPAVKTSKTWKYVAVHQDVLRRSGA